MHHGGFPRRLAIAAELLLAAAQPMRAAITAVATTPTSRTVPLARASSVSLVWNVTRATVGGTGGTTVSSLSGTFRAGSVTGVVIGTVTRSLSQSRPLAPITSFSFRESLLVPAEVVFRAHELGADRLFYVRTFDDGTGAATGAIELRVTGGAAGSYGVERLALTFENGSVIDVAEPEAELRAVARVTFSGSGLLRAVWEVTDPAGISGDAVLRPLVTVRRYVVARGSIELRSPPLPTHLTGSYRVRLRVTEPVPGFAAPELRYYVQAGTQARVSRLHVPAPAPGAVLHADTRFVWQAVPEALAYRLEIFDEADRGRAVTGVVVGGERTEAGLSVVSRGHLRPGRRYVWRVRAIGEGGRILAESEPRELFVP